MRRLLLAEIFDADDASPAPGSGTVTTNLERGALSFLSTPDEEFRLSWEATDSPGTGRVIPEGRYEITGYRVAARDEQGAEWFLAASRPFMREIEVIDGETLHVEIDPRVHLALSSTETRANVRVHGDDHAGMTIYRAGRRLPLGVKVSSPNGTIVAEGSFEYG